MNKTPQLLVTLNPQGELCIELPGEQATRRQVICRDSEIAATLHRILLAQALDRTEIGLDGAPTQAQVRHWERHEIWPDNHCRFCLAEGRARPDHGQFRQARKVLVSSCNGVEVRVIKSGQQGLGVQRAKKDAGVLGL